MIRKLLDPSGWCEVFKVGTHTDSQGRARTWSASDLDRMATSYDPSKHDAPICLDHEEGKGVVKGGPAYGWVESLKRAGDKLLAKFRKVAPEFADAVNRGLFEKRSISVYPDGTLRHVAWLGAQPPAIKGLEPFTFSAGEATDYLTYSEKILQEEIMPTVEELQAKLAAEQKSREETDAKLKLAEGAVSALTTENTKLTANFAEVQKNAKRQEIVATVEQGIVAGKILPAWKAAGLVDFMATLDTDTTTYQFAEGAAKVTPAVWFKSFLASFSEHPLFKEMTRPVGDKKPGDATDTAAEVQAMANKIATGSGYAAK